MIKENKGDCVVFLVKKMGSLVRSFITAKKVWVRPKKSEVLIFDAEGKDILAEYLKPYSQEILHIRHEQINIGVLIFSLFRKESGIRAYIDTYINMVSPRLVVTYIDNNIEFIKLGARHPKIKTLFIQNGWRGFLSDSFEQIENLDPSVRDKLKVDYMLTFGPVIANEYAKYIAGNVITMGSLLNNMAPCCQQRDINMIAFISQWGDEDVTLGDRTFKKEQYFMGIIRPVFVYLVAYAAENGKHLVIVPRSKKNTDMRDREQGFYRGLANHECEFIDPPGYFSSYKAIDTAEVVVSIDSTLGYESAARGNKTAIFSIRGELLNIPGDTYGWPGQFPGEGPFWTSRNDINAYARILNHLFEIDNEQWSSDLKATQFSSLMAYNSGNSILKSMLESQLVTGYGRN